MMRTEDVGRISSPRLTNTRTLISRSLPGIFPPLDMLEMQFGASPIYRDESSSFDCQSGEDATREELQ
jgi:hypothetical protein